MAEESKSLELPFTTRVLGQEGALRLRDQKITQTIRSQKEAYKFFRKRGTYVRVTLDGEYLYDARITEVHRKALKYLDQFDAEICGFDYLEDLNHALKRAGYRFVSLADYQRTYAIEFLPKREEAS